MTREDTTVRESVIEKYLVTRLKQLRTRYPYLDIQVEVKKIGGPGWRGWPDRMALFGGGTAHWLEVKRPKGGKFEPLQLRRHAQLRKMGFVVRVVNTKALVDAYIDEIVQYGSGLMGEFPSPTPRYTLEPTCHKLPTSSANDGSTAKKAAAKSSPSTISGPTSPTSRARSARVPAILRAILRAR